MGRHGRWAIPLALLASVALHVVGVRLVRAPPAPPPPPPVGDPMELPFVALEPPPTAAAKIPSTPPPPAPEPEPVPVPEAPEPCPPPSAATPAAPPPSEPPPPPAPTATQLALRAPTAAQLAPRVAALSMLPEVDACEPTDLAPRCTQTPLAGERLQSALEDAATDIPHLARRPPPRLRHQLDGTESYEGHVFIATIERDGHVRFEDRPVVPGFDDGKLHIGFDLTDAVEKHLLGKELYTSEKAWFLAETRALREGLADAHQRETLARAGLRLRGRLLRILEDSTRTPSARKRAIFALWDDCADDEIGRQAKRIVEAFVRDRAPEGSPLGYTPEELARFNEQRSSRQPFAPYTS